jgi:hypothetical protein
VTRCARPEQQIQKADASQALWNVEAAVANLDINSAVDVDARDAAIILSFALQHGADISAISRALCRDPKGNPSGIMGVVLDRIIAEAGP